MDRLRLPEPLDFDYIDELIDERFKFVFDIWTDYETGLKYNYVEAKPQAGRRSNYSRHAMELINDFGDMDGEEDEEGYLDNPPIGGMNWRAKWTEEDTDRYMAECFH